MKKLLLSMSMLVCVATQAQYATSFESSEGYILGPTPQGTWGSTTLATGREISADYASNGTQALKLTGNNGTDHNRAGVVSSASAVTADIVEVKFKFYYLPSADQANNGSDFFFAPQSPSESVVVTLFRFSYDQKIMVVDNASGTAAWEDTGNTFEFNQWNDCKMIINFANTSIEYYVNDTLVYTGSTWTAATKVENLAITNDNYESSAYFDEISYFDPALSTQAFDKNSFSVYPNPSKDLVTIANKGVSINNIEITDINGRVVKTVKGSNVSDVQINISDLNTGVYMMKISSEQGSVTKKVIKE